MIFFLVLVQAVSGLRSTVGGFAVPFVRWDRAYVLPVLGRGADFANKGVFPVCQTLAVLLCLFLAICIKLKIGAFYFLFRIDTVRNSVIYGITTTQNGVNQMTAPSLKRHEGSWVATHRTNGRVVEIFDRESAYFAAMSDDWSLETIGDYLARINAAVKS